MDEQRFDRLAKTMRDLVSVSDRRAVLESTLVGVLGGLGIAQSARAKSGRQQERKQRRRRKHKRRQAGDAPSDCENYMLRLGCTWAMGGGGFRWDCPQNIRAGEWRMSVCDGKSGITSLQGADLPAAYFAGADFQNVNLTYANLGQRLCGVSPCQANLNSTNLTGAKFDHAYLFTTMFVGANLKETTFTGAYLNCADFTGAFNWTEATFRGIPPGLGCFTQPSGSPVPGCEEYIKKYCPSR